MQLFARPLAGVRHAEGHNPHLGTRRTLPDEGGIALGRNDHD